MIIDVTQAQEEAEATTLTRSPRDLNSTSLSAFLSLRAVFAFKLSANWLKSRRYTSQFESHVAGEETAQVNNGRK